MFLTAKEAKEKLALPSYEKLYELVAAGCLQPYYINGEKVEEAKDKASCMTDRRPISEWDDYFAHHRHASEEEIHLDWRFRSTDCDPTKLWIPVKAKLTANERRAEIILQAIEELGYDRYAVENTKAVWNQCLTLAPPEFDTPSKFDAAWKYGNRENLWAHKGKEKYTNSK